MSLLDDFTGTGTALAHTSDSGHTWVNNPSYIDYISADSLIVPAFWTDYVNTGEVDA